MVTKPEKMILLSSMRDALESLRTSLIDVEALANSAEGSLQQVPYLPRLPQSLEGNAPRPWTREERRTFGRVQALVTATAQAAENALDEFEDLLRELQEENDGGRGPDDDGGDDDAGNGEEPPTSTLPPANGQAVCQAVSAIPTVLPRTRAGIVLDTQPSQL